MNIYFVHKDDAFIQEESNTKVLRDNEEGTRLYTFPISWTDEQIFIALEFANLTYSKGILYGKKLKAEEIRSVIWDT